MMSEAVIVQMERVVMQFSLAAKVELQISLSTHKALREILKLQLKLSVLIMLL